MPPPPPNKDEKKPDEFAEDEEEAEVEEEDEDDAEEEGEAEEGDGADEDVDGDEDGCGAIDVTPNEGGEGGRKVGTCCGLARSAAGFDEGNTVEEDVADDEADSAASGREFVVAEMGVD